MLLGFEGSSLPDGTRVKFHFVTKLTGQNEVLDDSRTWDKPMELILGKKFKLEVWETCLQTMAVGEVASFQVSFLLREASDDACFYEATVLFNYKARTNFAGRRHITLKLLLIEWHSMNMHVIQN